MKNHPTDPEVFWWKDHECGCEKECDCGNWTKNGLPYKKECVNEKTTDYSNLVWVNGDGSTGD